MEDQEPTVTPDEDQKPSDATKTESFLLDFVNATTLFWVGRLSFAAIPPLRMHAGGTPHQVQRNRDIFVLSMVSLSVVSLGLFQLGDTLHITCLMRALAAFAIYRCFDLLITLIRTGIFMSFRGDVPLKAQQPWRIQRILIGVMANYIEVINWFSIIYRQISLNSPCEFADEVKQLHQGFNLSFSTVTTIGYGKYTPNGWISELLALMQVLIGIILLVLVVGSILALLTAPPNPAKWVPEKQKGYVITPLTVFVCLFIFWFWFFGLSFGGSCQASENHSIIPIIGVLTADFAEL